MKLQTLEDLLVHQIQDILSAEYQVKQALPGMAEAAGSDKLCKAFEHHQKETAECGIPSVRVVPRPRAPQ